MGTKEKAASPGRGEAALNNTLKPNCSASTPKTQGRRLPAYGRALIDAQRNGRNVPCLVLSLDWKLGRAFPRVVIPADVQIAELDLHLVARLECMVAHRDETTRALDVAELALSCGAKICPVIDVQTGQVTYTDEIIAARKVAA